MMEWESKGILMTGRERLPPLTADKMTPEQKKAADDFKASRGYDLLGPFSVMLRSPEVMVRTQAVGQYLRYRNVLPKRVSEMVILVTARQWTQQFEWAHHYKYAMEAGLAKSIADAIAEGRRPQGMGEDETAAYEFSIELHRNKSVSDATYARALELFGEQGIIDLTGLNGYYSMLAMMMNVARTPNDTHDVKPLEPFPN
jgi:4-carboxymuconolactone decarboxylase